MTTCNPTLPQGRLVDRSQSVHFFFEGQSIAAFAGQTFAAALYDAGVRIFSRSFKYHRPRGLFCVSGRCPNCMMEVDGIPNVRICTEAVREGACLKTQNSWPDVRFDLLCVFDRLDRFLPVGFYYKRMYRPRWMWPIYESVIRHLAGLGRVDAERPPAKAGETVNVHADLTVVGAGPAGMMAALEAADAGARVVLLDRERAPGGRLLYQACAHSEPSGPPAGVLHPQHPRENPASPRTADAATLLSQLTERLRLSERIEYCPQSTAFGVYEGLLIAAMQRNRLLRIRTRQLLLATGCDDRPLVFHNNDLPGVMLGRAAQRLLHLDGVLAGRRALIVTEGARGYALAADLAEQGVEIAGIVDRQPSPAAPLPNGVPIFSSHAITAAIGRQHVRGAWVAPVDAQGTLNRAAAQRLACDLICLCVGQLPVNELLFQAGCRMTYALALSHHMPEQFPPGVFAAGDVVGAHDLESILLQGQWRGAEAALALGLGNEALRERCRTWSDELSRRAALLEHRATTAPPPYPSLTPSLAARQRKRFVCLCEDVTEKDLCQAVAEGFDNIETLKRYSTVCMGPCQGKVCALASVEICARETNHEIAQIGTTTNRPPAHPVALRLLAGKYGSPIKETPLACRHDPLGARWMYAGAWRRPESYGDPDAEYLAVRHRVGLIDVSTLGKVELLGPDVTKLLERIYVNQWAKLPVGRVRYGVMCTEDGIILDDGTCCRLGEEHFFMTTTTGNAAAIFSWLQRWRDVWQLNVELLDVSADFAALSLAGPLAREVLGKLTDADLRAEAAPYMSVTQAMVAGVSSRILRIGFVGEVGYEIHVSSSFAPHVWDQLMNVGQAYGMRAVGVEAQRRLRLDKGHLIIGQDSDALSDPLAAGMEWIVKFNKPMFLGKQSLERRRQQGARERLVAFVIDETHDPPAEGTTFVRDGLPVGRVTSARYSQACARVIGLGWVQSALSQPGQALTVLSEAATLLSARVVQGAFYDPTGERLRS